MGPSPRATVPAFRVPGAAYPLPPGDPACLLPTCPPPPAESPGPDPLAGTEVFADDAPELASELIRRPVAVGGAPLPGPGDVLAGEYEVVRFVGRGAFGAVLEARDRRLGRRVAVKVIGATAGAGGKPGEPDTRLRRFEEEMRALARVSHPNVVTLYTPGRWSPAEGGPAWPLMVMELVEGPTLAARLAAQGPLPPEEALLLAEQLLDGLRALHRAGVVHRDLKPANLAVTADGRLKILDLGLALAARDWTSVEGPRQAPGEIAGTPAYMSPEQLRGEPVGEQADLWAAGVVLFEMLAGTRPWGRPGEASPAEERRRILAGDALSLASAAGDLAPWHARLQPLLDRALATDPAQRFATADDMLGALRALGRRGTAPAGAGRSAGASPYQDLAPFREEDADRFHGRSPDVARLAARTEREGRLLLSGPSGAGKTSLVQAGIVPALRRVRDLEVVTVRPGPAPLDDLAAAAEALMGLPLPAGLLRERPRALAEALREHARRRGRLLLIVDAVEALLARGTPRKEAARALEAIVATAREAGGDLLVVITVRSDFVGRLPELGAGDPAGELPCEYLAPPSRAGLREALIRPAADAGVPWADDLADELVESLAGSPAPLPLLQVAASWLWSRRDGAGALDRSLLPDPGATLRLDTCLAGWAEDLVRARGWTEKDHALASLMLPGLVDEDGLAVPAADEDLLARVRAPERARAAELLGHLTDARLLVSSASAGTRSPRGRPERALVHQALADRWPFLREALQRDEALEHLRKRLERDARAWDSHGRDPAWLWPPEAARALRDRRHELTGRLTPVQEAFAGAVLGQAARRRKRWLVAAVAGGFLVAAVAAATLVALDALGDAGRERDRAARAGLDAIVSSRQFDDWLEVRQRWLSDDALEALRGDGFEGALGRAMAARELARLRSERSPGDVGALISTGAAEAQIGILYRGAGRAHEARDAFERAAAAGDALFALGLRGPGEERTDLAALVLEAGEVPTAQAMAQLARADLTLAFLEGPARVDALVELAEADRVLDLAEHAGGEASPQRESRDDRWARDRALLELEPEAGADGLLMLANEPLELARALVLQDRVEAEVFAQVLLYEASVLVELVLGDPWVVATGAIALRDEVEQVARALRDRRSLR